MKLMPDSVTKKDMEQYQKTVIDAVNFSLRSMEQRMDEKYAKEEVSPVTESGDVCAVADVVEFTPCDSSVVF